jgi:hypothetical protein
MLDLLPTDRFDEAIALVAGETFDRLKDFAIGHRSASKH